ncbi:heavy metal-binding domain-containing protein [Hymenobacter sp. 102]|uniref:heavy metal-binding domain-containing protein n=1 Tax=Hymenobacter sp. 102 TaxID=3403152 RepID=UPI003CF0F5D3
MNLTLWSRVICGSLLVAALGLTGCESKPAAQEAATTPTLAAPADSAATPVATAAYICPMGCKGSESDKPGKCPVCGMELEPNPVAKTATEL